MCLVSTHTREFVSDEKAKIGRKAPRVAPPVAFSMDGPFPEEEKKKLCPLRNISGRQGVRLARGTLCEKKKINSGKPQFDNRPRKINKNVRSSPAW